LTVPFPLPLPPLVIVIQVALLVAVHAQPVAVVTLTLAAPPAAVGLAEVGDAVKLHGAVKLNVLESALGALPPGPTAATSAT
jgi:hypothetical protein